ncbi:MAG: GLPGLI family protein [Bacteroidetes bacterium]|nr:GLPGLI family protein [Bacteroidota bacterium]MBS1649200.1 GLPGLI family protein [Bacteroidota bacterium]
MKKLFLLTYIVCNSLILKIHAQQTLIAKYNFTHIRDTTQPLNPYNEEMILFTNNNTAIYKSYPMYLLDSLLNSNTSISNIKVPKGTTEQIFTSFTSKEIILIRPWLQDTFGIKYPLQDIIWQLIDSTKKIGNFICNKAIGEYGGRKYACWYCPQIAVRSGPWKLNGLPGLIISAVDEKNQVSFALNAIRQANYQEITIPKDITYITEKKFSEMKEAFKANPNAVLGNTLGNDNVNFQKKGNGNSNYRLNNPLELN